MKPRLIKAIVFVAVLEIIYLAVVNLAFNLPWTQTLINQYKPEKFLVHWDRAWSWFPFKVHVRGISANGQTASLQWQVQSPAVSGTVSILPLLQRSLSINQLNVQDIVYHQRPRPKPGKDYSAIREYFPMIKDRKLEESYVPPATAEKPKKTRQKRRRWKINLTDAHVRGSHRIWIYQIQGVFQGETQIDLAYETRGGPLVLKNGRVDLSIDSVKLNRDQEVVRQGYLRGTVEMAPFVPSENKGIKSLPFLKAALDISTETESLAFLNFYLQGFHGMEVDGAGKLGGRIVVENGNLQPETDLTVVASKLSMDLLSYRSLGSGNINLRVNPGTPDTTDVAIEFGSLQAFHAQSPQPLVSGEGLLVKGRGGTALVPIDSEASKERYLAVSIPSLKVPDLRGFQRYLPARWTLKLYGGQGELEGKAEMSPTGFNIYMRLASQDADVDLKDYRFTTNLDLSVQANCPSIAAARIDIGGTYIRLDNARLSREQREKSVPWSASLAIEEGRVMLPLPEEILKDANNRQLWAALAENDVTTLLENGEGRLKLRGKISDLRWLNALLKNPYYLAVNGAGELTADVSIASGWPASGTILKIFPDELNVNFLEYVSAGDGQITLEVKKGGQQPDLNLNVVLDNALFKRLGEKEAFIENVAIKLQALGRGMSYARPGGNMELDLQIPSATVKNMAVYNHYLPPKSPFAFVGGKANLSADIHLKPTSASGFVRLKTEGMQSRIDEQNVSGELTADINLAGGVPPKMDFDISGSSLVLDRVRVVGEQKNFEAEDWYARLDLKKGRAVWTKPTRIEVDAAIEMRDTRPMVAILANQRGKHGWIENILTVEGVKGEARMSMAQEKIVIPYAFTGSDNIDVGVKGVISEQTREGVFYVRFKKLDGILKIKNNDRNFDILGARKTFDEYSPERVTP